MVYELNNGCLSLAVDSRGAQLLRLDSAEGHPFLWEGDEKYWPDHSPLLFPFVGRLTKDSYRLGEQTYSMPIHGFAAAQTFRLIRQEQDRLVLALESSPETLAIYPFHFSLEVEYQLCQNTLSICYTVRNRDSRVMPFGIGGHPGFRLPMEPGREFSDYWLEFESPCLPARVLTTPQVYLSGREEDFPLEQDRILRLHHRLFDDDAITLKNMARAVTLRAENGPFITLRYPDMPYLGIWHTTGSDAPFVCIEPWTSLPSRQDVVEDLWCKSDLIQLAPGKEYQNGWSITIEQN